MQHPFNTVVLDTMILIYLFEDIAPFASQCLHIFQQIHSGAMQGVVTPITMAEIIVKPLQANAPEIADKYRSSIKNFPNLVLSSITPETAIMAGALRAKYNLPLPDLFQVATAMEYNATLVSNDKALKRINEIPVQLLQE